MIYPYYYNIYNKRYVFFILLTLNIVQFISVHIYFLYSIKLPKKNIQTKNKLFVYIQYEFVKKKIK